MSNRAPEVGIFVPILLLAVFAENFDKISARFSRYWDLHIAPTVNFIFYLIFWFGAVTLGVIVSWIAIREFYRYCSLRRIILRDHYDQLLSVGM